MQLVNIILIKHTIKQIIIGIYGLILNINPDTIDISNVINEYKKLPLV